MINFELKIINSNEKNTLKLSVVIPLYNCIDSLDELIERLLKSLKF